jgi:outer membrane protein assembly factor BamB
MAVLLRNVAVTFAIIVLALIAGAASVHFKFFPGESLSLAFVGFEALSKQYEDQKSLYNWGAITPANTKKRGVTRWKEGAAQDGFTLFSMGHGKRVELQAMDGTPVHQWEVSYTDIWDDSGDIKELVPERFIYIRKARMYPDGRLLVIFSCWSSTPYGYGIAMLDRDSNVLWKDFRRIHHSFDQAEDGRIYTMDHEIKLSEGLDYADTSWPFLDDGIVAYTAEGEFLSRFSLLDAIQNSPYSDVFEALILKNAGLSGGGDLLHSNDVEVLPAHLAEKFPFANAGDLLVSLRQIDSIVVIDPETESVKWFQKGYWRRQHDPDFLENGNMLIFDNHALKKSSSGKQTSRVIEFDPKNMAVIWEYRPTGDEEFFTSSRGSQQRLTNGNTLITESGKGRMIEVSPSGEVVWEYYNQTRIGPDDGLVPSIFWGIRYTPEQIEFL